MRQRVEDLGRISVLVRNLTDHRIFDDSSLPYRRKDYWEWFSQLTEEKKEEVIHSWVYGIDDLKEKLYEVLEIAEGTDPLNEQE